MTSLNSKARSNPNFIKFLQTQSIIQRYSNGNHCTQQVKLSRVILNLQKNRIQQELIKKRCFFLKESTSHKFIRVVPDTSPSHRSLNAAALPLSTPSGITSVIFVNVFYVLRQDVSCRVDPFTLRCSRYFVIASFTRIVMRPQLHILDYLNGWIIREKLRNFNRYVNGSLVLCDVIPSK